MGSFAVLGKAPYVLKAHEKKKIRNPVPERERAADRNAFQSIMQSCSLFCYKDWPSHLLLSFS